MSLSALPQVQVKKWRVIVFASVAGLLALLAFYGGIGDLLLLPGQSGFPSIIGASSAIIGVWYASRTSRFILLGSKLSLGRYSWSIRITLGQVISYCARRSGRGSILVLPVAGGGGGASALPS